MSLGNGNPKEGDKGSNFNYELNVLQGLEAIAVALENQPPASGGLFAEIANSTPIANTITPGSLLGTIVGTASVPANTFQVGDSFHLKMLGHLGSRNNAGLRISVYSNGTILLGATGSMTLPACTDKHWELNMYFTIRALGAAGTASIMSGGMFNYTQNAATTFQGTNFTEENNTTFDTTVQNTLSVIAEWDGTSTLNSIYSEVAILQKIY
jgi:hypothetical protein